MLRYLTPYFVLALLVAFFYMEVGKAFDAEVKFDQAVVKSYQQ